MHLINIHHWFVAIFLIIWKRRASANMLFLDKKKGKTNMFLEKINLQTSYSMANALNVLPTSHSFGDMILLTRASELAKVKNICLFLSRNDSSFSMSIFIVHDAYYIETMVSNTCWTST